MTNRLPDLNKGHWLLSSNLPDLLKSRHKQPPVLAAAITAHVGQAGAAEDLATGLALVDRVAGCGVVAVGTGVESAHGWMRLV